MKKSQKDMWNIYRDSSIWNTRTGETIFIKEMSTEHIQKAILFFRDIDDLDSNRLQQLMDLRMELLYRRDHFVDDEEEKYDDMYLIGEQG